jgi:hypothetical protein
LITVSGEEQSECEVRPWLLLGAALTALNGRN